MNQTLELSTIQSLPYAQQFANTHTLTTFHEIPAEQQITDKQLSIPFTIYEHNLLLTPLQSAQWLWEKRLPLAGITLLDGDHACGKSLLALQIAAAVSSGTPLPDGTPTIQGGVATQTKDWRGATDFAFWGNSF